jgi:hypothetical protein
MPADELRDPHLAALTSRMSAIRSRTRALVVGLTPERLMRPSPAGGWNAAQVFEHMILANVSYERPVDRAIARARARRGSPRPFRSTLGGGFLIRSLAGTKNLPTVGKYRPLTVRPGVVEAFLQTLDWVEDRMKTADGLDLRVMLSSPVVPILRMNVGEAFEVAVVHSERHLGQIERALK